LRWLKRIRVASAIVFFLAVSFLFLDIYHIIPGEVYTFFTATQLGPVLLRTIVSIGLLSIGLIFILGLTLLFGRVYCSAICPLGILQDVVIHFAKRINKRRWFKFRKPSYTVHYVLLLVVIAPAFLGSMILLDLLEPYSNYGRILSALVKPFAILVNNGIAYLFELFNVLIVARIPLIIDPVAMAAAFVFFGFIIYLSYFHGRLFCNLLCPAGALLGIISRFSLFRIAIEEEKCNECGLCEMVCKANCIESESKKIDFAACVGCFNCIQRCKPNGVKYKFRWGRYSIPKIKFDKKRRQVITSSIIPFLGLLQSKFRNRGYSENGSKGFHERRKNPVSPPGSISIEHFTNHCTACHLCISSCPTQVLYPSALEYGLAGIFQPKMDFSLSYCSYDCSKCGQVCPTGAILPLDLNEKKLTQIGIAHFVKMDCIVERNKRDCGACSEHCPTKAVHMVPYGDLSIPEVTDEFCIGCGACEYACPAEPEKAIYVISNPEHKKAVKRQTKKTEPAFDGSQDFPF
jgi:ferredoxin-type protein NapF